MSQPPDIVIRATEPSDMPAVTEPELSDLDPFALMAGEAARIDAFYRESGDWRVPTRCAGWNRRDLLAHLAGVEDDTTARLSGAPLPPSYVAEAALSRRAHLSDGDLLAEWRAHVDRRVDEVLEPVLAGLAVRRVTVGAPVRKVHGVAVDVARLRTVDADLAPQPPAKVPHVQFHVVHHAAEPDG